MKIVFLSDAHAGPVLEGLARKVWKWALGEVSREKPDIVILGGDLWQTQANAGKGEWLEEIFGALPDARFFSIPGNRDPEGFKLNGNVSEDRIRFVKGSLRVELGAVDLLLLDSNVVDRGFQVLSELAARRSGGMPLLVAGHQPFTQEELEALPTRGGGLIIAGHRHRHLETASGQWRQVVCAGLDPLKTWECLPEIVIIEALPGNVSCRSFVIPDRVLWAGRAREVVVGIAPSCSMMELTELAIAHRIPMFQVLLRKQKHPPTTEELQKLADWRKEVPGAFLSCHLPDPVLAAESGDMGGLDGHLVWCAPAGFDDYTIHLPNVPADRVYNADGAFLDTAETSRMREIYLHLGKAVLSRGAWLSIENHHNDDEHSKGGRPDRLSSRPEHILRMIDWLRGTLTAEGWSVSDVERIGWIYDSGHARNNGAVTNELSLADWLALGSDVLQTAHIHQVRYDEAWKLKNHFAIRSIHEGFINHEGLLAAFAQTPGPTVRAFIEVRDAGEAVESWKLLSAMMDDRMKNVQENTPCC